MDYQATYRRSAFAIPALLVVMALLAGGIALALREPDGNVVLSRILWLLAATVIATLIIFAGAFRVHRWTITPQGVDIAERPKVPFFGLRRRASLSFAQIARFYRLEVGLDRQIELVAYDGRSYRLSQAMKAGVGADPDAILDDFLAAIQNAAMSAGAHIPEPSEALSFWNSIPGLACLTVMLALALAIGVMAGWALIDGMVSSGPRSGYGTAIALLLPFGAGWLLVKSWRRRRLVLKQRSGG